MNVWTFAPSMTDSFWYRRIAEMDMTAPVVSLEACARFIFFNLEHYTQFDPFCYIVQYEEGLNFYVDFSIEKINIFSHEYRIHTSVNSIPWQLEDIYQFLLFGFNMLIINTVHVT